MPETDIGNTSITDFKGTFEDYSVDSTETDGAGDQDETEYHFNDWSQYFGYYNKIPELRAAIDTKATWTVGKGFEADDDTTFLLDTLKGWGRDTFNTIIENLIRVYYIAGDAFAEIIRDEEGNLINLKPLDTGAMKVVVDAKGMIKRYEQVSKVKAVNKKFKPENIFHLSRNRVADQIHGTSLIEALEDIIKMRNEAMSDYKTVMHRNVAPVRIWYLDTDDPGKIATFKSKVSQANEDHENLFVPKGAVELDQASVAPNSTLNPLPWIQFLNQSFFQAVGIPQIILGNSGEFTEATAKIAYLAFQQSTEEEQLFLEEQIGQQLGLLLEFQFPASLENELLSDQKKDGAENIQPNATTAGSGQ